VAAQLLGQLGEEQNQKQMLNFFEQYLPRFQAEKSGHEFKA
jgi:DTW domain-containing protein YfiP